MNAVAPGVAQEEAFFFDCEGEALLGVLHHPATGAPAAAATTGVVVIVGGPQYRAGSHRQFVHLARALAAAGHPVLRFDVRGMGDSTGNSRSFEQITPDIGAAIDALCKQAPSVQRVVLWGLCDAASAALLYLQERNDPRVQGLCLANPWVRSPATLARTHIKHYYTRRLRERDFWIKLLSGRVAATALRGLWGNLRAARPKAKAEGHAFQERMAKAWSAFDGRIGLTLSGDDYTAKEFLEFAATTPSWTGLLGRQLVRRHDLPAADHTFSSCSDRQALESITISWLTNMPQTAATDAALADHSSGCGPGQPTRDQVDTHGGSHAPKAAMPRGSVLGWSSFAAPRAARMPSVLDLAFSRKTSSGRAAIYLALQQLRLPQGATVLVPTYHCPTMIAPVVQAGLKPCFYPIGPDGLPLLERITPEQRDTAGAILVAHLLDRARSLANVRHWCDQHSVPLIEDCSHTLFGMAGTRPVGCWGDYATASLTKFLPVPELGVLASAHHKLQPHPLPPPRLKSQIKAVWNTLERAAQHRRPAGLHHVTRGLMRVKHGMTARRIPTHADESPAEQDLFAASDMSRVQETPTWFALALSRTLPLGTIPRQRQANYDSLNAMLSGLEGAHPLFGASPRTAAPYAFGLWVDDADGVYHELRRLGLPVFRWDRVWPGTPTLAGDSATLWRQHVLQILCHQDLSTADILTVGLLVKAAVGGGISAQPTQKTVAMAMP